MRKITSVLALTVVFLTGTLSYVQAQNENQSNTATLPDITEWEKTTFKCPAVLNRNEIEVTLDQYLTFDSTNSMTLIAQVLTLVYNPDNNRLWFAVYVENVAEEKTNGAIVLKEVRGKLFESADGKVDGKWLLVKEFPANSNPEVFNNEVNRVLEKHYKLEWR